MFKNKKVSLVVFGALALILVVGVFAFSPTMIASAEEAIIQHGRGGRGGQKAPGYGGEEFLAEALGITMEELETAKEEARSGFEGRPEKDEMNAAFADALGITVEELDAAREIAKDAAIEQALADGKITEEQVAMMEAREALKDYIDKDAMMADVLGISVAELEAAKEDGQRIPDLLEKLGIAEETFKADVQAAQEAALQQAGRCDRESSGWRIRRGTRPRNRNRCRTPLHGCHPEP